MNIKTKNEAVGKFEQALVDMLNKVYGDSKNVKIDSAPVSGGTMYIVGDSWNEVDFLVLKDETGKDMNYPALTIYINGEETKKHHGNNGMTLKTFYGLHDADPDMLRTCQQILQKYIDGVDLDLPWLRFEESKKNEENETELSKLVKAYCLATGGEDAVPDKVEMVDKTTINDDGDVLLEFDFENEKENGTSGTTYALVCGDLYRNTDNDLLYFLHDWQSGEKVTPEDVYDHDWELANDVIKPSEILKESKKSEADYSTSHVSKSIADAYKSLDDYYCNNDGSLRKDFMDQIMTTFVNERDLYNRSQSKAVKSHSLAWDVLCREINAHLEWDDETPHATKLTSEQVKNWFKLKGRDFKEDLKPLVDAIDAYRNKKESKGESMKNEANIEDLKGMVVSEGTMGVNALIRKYLDVLETYAPDNYKAYIEANPELKDRGVWMALDVQDKSYIVDELADELDKIAPEGYYFGASEGDGACYGFWSVDPDESKCGDGKDDKDKKPEESAKPVKNILRRRFEVLTKSVLHACDKLVKDTSLAGEFDDEVIYAEDAVKNAIESFNAMGDAIVRLKTVLESHKNEDNMEIIGILSDAITKIVADEQGDETDAATAGADSVIDQVEREYGNEPENEPEANGEENEAPSPAGAEAPDEF